MERMWKLIFVKWLLLGVYFVVIEYSRNLRCLKDLVIIKCDGYFFVVFYIVMKIWLIIVVKLCYVM